MFEKTPTMKLVASGTRLTVDGPLRTSPKEIALVRDVLANQPSIVEVRFFHVDFAKMEDDFRMALTDLLNSRKFERTIIAFCTGTVSKELIAGMLQTRKFDIYGRTLNILEDIGKALESNLAPIEFLRFRTRFDSVNILPLAKGLAASSCLRELHLTCEFLDRDSILCLGEGLKENKALEVLSLYSCDLFDEESTELFFSCLQDHPKLASLEFRNNTYLGMAALAELVRKTQNLTRLALYHPPHRVEQIEIPRLNVESLSLALQQNQSLKTLNLTGNGLQSASALWLALAMRANSTLETLNLQDNSMTDQGIEALAEALKENKGLKKLYLWNNPFSGAGARTLLDALKLNDSLQEVSTFTRFRCSGELQFYTHFNRAGRKLLTNSNGIPLSLWPTILAQSNRQTWPLDVNASIMYGLFREGPAGYVR